MFCAEYLIDLNATQAAIRAGYSEKQAAIIGHENLRKPNIAAAIAERQKERSQRVEITQDRVLKELARVAFADPRSVMTWGPNGVRLKDSADLTADEAALVAEASESSTGIKLKTNDRLKALELIGKHLGMFTDKIEHSGTIDRPFEGMSREKLLKAIELAENGKL